ncbi:glycosyltransferase family 2 protein [Pseudomonas sp. BGI-2]|uniref:glycosyltransferase family 2 protein n=1 Tax=Pseudomonas sp. BGI-2 TaxID=2528211 RepID=UPI001034AAFB|nr:glycosyltransferase family 2 protein [Pseudomonas sp. BGI-2]TBN43365.1 glycosyltransferase family 2 protein [Pseudomonas sp. BGI-2]
MKASVSVIMPHYNALDTIKRSIDSVVSQTLSVGELIIVDDGSPAVDKLKLLVLDYKSIIDIVLIESDVNRGAAHARNTGIKHSKCKYIAFLDSDDVWHPEKIKLQYSVMEKNEMFLSGHGYMFNLYNQNFQATVSSEHTSINRNNFILGNPFFTPTVMARRECFISFDERYRRVDDYKCWYENLCNGTFALLSSDLAGGFKAPIGASGLSGSLKLMHVAYLDVLKSLLVEKNMRYFEYLMAATCERMKYPLRVMLFKFRGK